MKKILTEQPPKHPRRRPEVIAAAVEALETGDWARLEGAPETEQALMGFHGGGEIWFVASGTAALEAILLGHGIGPGDEVITVPYTWGATVSAILAVGAIPVFADVDPASGLIDPNTVEDCITSRTKAILGVHLFGTPFDAPRLRDLSDRTGIYLFEDGSQAHGARIGDRRVGRFGHAAAFSCMGLKPLGGTEGGYVIFEDPEVAERAYLHGKHPRGLPESQADKLSAAGLLDSLQLGWRSCTVSAALVRANLPYLDAENKCRRENAEELRTLLEDIPHVSMAPEPEGTTAVHHLMSLWFHEKQAGCSRETFLAKLAELGVETFVYIPTPIHRLTRLDWRNPNVPPTFWHRQLKEVDYRVRDCPGAEERSRSTLEMGWNWTEPNDRAMKQMAEALQAAVPAS